MTTTVPRELTKPLKALLRRVRRMQLLRGLCGLATVIFGGLLALMAPQSGMPMMPPVSSPG